MNVWKVCAWKNVFKLRKEPMHVIPVSGSESPIVI